MKRIVILIDGAWNEEHIGLDTNVAKLDPAISTDLPLIKPIASGGIEQKVFYHKGVGAEPDLLKRILGGAIGIGLKIKLSRTHTDRLRATTSLETKSTFSDFRGEPTQRAL